MAPRKGFSSELKEAIVTKILNRGNQSIEEICRREGIASSTAFKWIKEHADVGIMKKNKKSKKWTAEDKLKTIIKTSAMDDDELGVHLRREGLHSHQLDEWREEILKSLGPTSNKPQQKDERDGKIKELERELRRKDKALAEASALLILQKKIDLIWGNKDEDEK